MSKQPTRTYGHITHDIILDHVPVQNDFFAIKRVINTLTLRSDGQFATDRVEEQALIRAVDLEPMRNGKPFESINERYRFVLLNDTLAKAIAKHAKTAPVLMIASPSEFGLTADDVRLLDKPFDCVVAGHDHFPTSANGYAGHYIDLRTSGENLKVIPKPITFSGFSGLMIAENYDLDKAWTHLESLPNVSGLTMNENAQRWWTEGQEGVSSLDFQCSFDEDTYRKILELAIHYRNVGHDPEITTALAVFELDALGLRAAGTCFADSISTLTQ